MSHPANVQAVIDAVRAGGATVTYLPAGVQQPVADLRAAVWPTRRWARLYGDGEYHGVGGEPEFLILDTGVIVTNSTSLNSNSGSHEITIPEGTTGLIVILYAGVSSGLGAPYTNVQFDGDAMASVAAATNFGTSSPNMQIFKLAAPDAGAANLTFDIQEGLSTEWRVGHFVCFSGVHADIAGASEVLANGGDLNTRSDSITSQADNSILLCAITVQGDDASPYTALEDLEILEETSSGGGSTTIDSDVCLAWKQLGDAGSYDYGFSWSTADGQGLGAVEIKAA